MKIGGRLVRFGSLSLVALVVALSLLPVASPGAAANDEDVSEQGIISAAGQLELANVASDEAGAGFAPDLEVLVDDGVVVDPSFGDDPVVERAVLDELELGDPPLVIEHGELSLKKWVCPEDIDLTSEDWAYYLSQCTVSMNGVTFTLVTEGGSALIGVTGAGGVDGEAVWSGLTPGPITLSEDIPSGYRDPVVFCGWGAIYDEDGDGLAIAVDGFIPPSAVVGGVLHHELLPNAQVYCDWFNIPAPPEYGSLTISKWTCPAGYDLWAPGADPAADCLEPTNGITFTLRSVGMVDQQTDTGDAIFGAVSWGGLELGDYEVQETVPDNVVALLATCTWYEDLGPYVYQTLVPDGDGRIALSLVQGDDIVCDWYNVPEQEWQPGGELIVVKYWCDGMTYSPSFCDPYGGVPFVLQAASGEGDPIFFTTGANGTSQLSLPAGAYTLDEVGRAWCYAKSPDVDAAGNIVVTDGETSIVYVYNCGPDKPEKPGKQGPPVKQLPNTGSGPAAALAATGTDVLGGVTALLSLAPLAVLIGGRVLGLTRSPAWVVVRTRPRA